MGIAVLLVSDIGWGVLPLYWRALSSMNAISVLAYRLVATLVAMVALLVAFPACPPRFRWPRSPTACSTAIT